MYLISKVNQVTLNALIPGTYGLLRLKSNSLIRICKILRVNEGECIIA